jgi:hypothetical protein
MEHNKQLEHIAEMRALMERSTRFLSLSGLSGVWAGCWALLGVAFVYWYAEMPSDGLENGYYYERIARSSRWGISHRTVFPILGIALLATVLAGGYYFTARKARKRGESVWDNSSRRFAKALFIPLAIGGTLAICLLWRDVSLVAPVTLIFYGLALVNGAAYTLRDVEYLGYLQILLGFSGVFFPGHGLEAWAIGFGLLHIFYGLLMHLKYG